MEPIDEVTPEEQIELEAAGVAIVPLAPGSAAADMAEERLLKAIRRYDRRQRRLRLQFWRR